MANGPVGFLLMTCFFAASYACPDEECFDDCSFISDPCEVASCQDNCYTICISPIDVEGACGGGGGSTSAPSLSPTRTPIATDSPTNSPTPPTGLPTASFTTLSPVPSTPEPSQPTVAPTFAPTGLRTGGSCISGDMKVTTHGDFEKYVKDLEIGDLVQVGQGIYEPILWQTEHRTADNTIGNKLVQALFIEVALENDQVISLTPNHYVVSTDGEILTRNVNINSSVLIGSDGKHLRVLSLTQTLKIGVFNPQTPSQRIVINGIMVSTRSEGSPASWFMSATLLILHLLFNLLPETLYAELVTLLRQCIYEPIYFGEVTLYQVLVTASVLIYMVHRGVASKK